MPVGSLAGPPGRTPHHRAGGWVRREAPLRGRGHPVRPEASGFPSHSAKRLPSWRAESSSDSVLAGCRMVRGEPHVEAGVGGGLPSLVWDPIPLCGCSSLFQKAGDQVTRISVSFPRKRPRTRRRMNEIWAKRQGPGPLLTCRFAPCLQVSVTVSVCKSLHTCACLCTHVCLWECARVDTSVWVSGFQWHLRPSCIFLTLGAGSLESFHHATVSFLCRSTLRNGEQLSLDFNADGCSLIYTLQFWKERRTSCVKKEGKSDTHQSVRR